MVAQRVKHVPPMRETWVWSLGQEDPLEKKWQPTPVLLPGKSHGRRSLVGYSPWGRKEVDTTEWLHFHFWLTIRTLLKFVKRNWESPFSTELVIWRPFMYIYSVFWWLVVQSGCFSPNNLPCTYFCVSLCRSDSSVLMVLACSLVLIFGRQFPVYT